MSALAHELDHLYARAGKGIRLGLEPMRAACSEFGHPEHGPAYVHVAGTNGKGSVCAMIEHGLRRAGCKTGLYTSPHLFRFAERIRVDGEPIDDEALSSVLESVRVGAPELSFFEAATLAAFLAFRRSNVDVVVLEVGLGGRLDATNVISSHEVSAITSIGFDHTDRLGDDLAAIAREKASIAREGRPMVLGKLPQRARAAAWETAAELGAVPSASGDDREIDELADRADIALAGKHQKENARVAAACMKRLSIPSKSIKEALSEVSWPARLQRVRYDDVDLLVDSAHNADGARALARYLRGEPPPLGGRHLVFGAMADKAWPNMIDALDEDWASAHAVAPPGRQAADPADLARALSGHAHRSVAEALEAAARAARPDGEIVVTGSIFLCASVLAHVTGAPCDPPIAL